MKPRLMQPKARTARLTCGITMGEPSGIGPEVTLKALQEKTISRLANFLIIGNWQVVKRAVADTKVNVNLVRIKGQDHITTGACLGPALLDVGRVSRLVMGQPNAETARVAGQCLQLAVRLVKLKKIDVLVTAPVNKYTLNQVKLSREKFCGHTEYLARAFKVKHVAMMLVAPQLKVALVTTHLALKNVPRALTKEKISATIRLTDVALKEYFRILRPRIGVCGLNPHSGDEGTFGQEELKLIRPAIKAARSFSRVQGPLPADTLFYQALQGQFDAVIAMYHDQGLIPLKMLNLHQGVNLTLGLPFVRTSPDHGTADNIAGKNQADPGSMIEAIKLAVSIGKLTKQCY